VKSLDSLETLFLDILLSLLLKIRLHIHHSLDISILTLAICGSGCLELFFIILVTIDTAYPGWHSAATQHVSGLTIVYAPSPLFMLLLL